MDPRKGTVAVLSDPGTGPEGARHRGRHDCVFGDIVQVGRRTAGTRELPPYA